MTPPTLQRFVGVRALALMIVTVTVGAGIFGMPALAAHDLGASAVLAYIACAIIIGLVGLCLAEAGSRVSGTGGLYAFATASFGPFAGGMVGMLLLTANGAFSNAAVAALFADSVALLLPAFVAPMPRALLLIATYGVFATLNIRGAREGAAVTQLITVIKLLPLVLLVVAGVFFIDPANLRWTVTPTFGTVTHASTALIFAFIGIEGALSLSGEVAAPARTIPRAILVAMTGVVVLYIGVQLVAQGVLGDALRGASTAPLADTARVIFGSAGATFVLVATIISILGYFAADILAQPRVLLALGEDGFLPKRVGAVHPIRKTPVVAIACYVGLALILALTGTFAALALVAASGTLAMYLICCVGVLRLRAKGIRGTEPPFVIPGGPLVPLLAALGILGLLSSLARSEVYALGLVVVVCAIPYGIRRVRMREPVRA
ncbi:MAG: APC family permease [Gemmatimonadaceae bacterium]